MGSRGLIPDDNVHRVPLNLLSRPLHPTRQFCHALKMTTTQIDFMNRDDDAKSIYAPAGLPMSIRLERDGRNGKWCVVLIARFRQKLKLILIYPILEAGVRSIHSFLFMPNTCQESIQKKKKRWTASFLIMTQNVCVLYRTQYAPLLCRLGLVVTK